MPRWICILLLVFIVAEARAEPAGQRFVSIAFHDVVDRPADLSTDAVTTSTLVQFFDWLKGTGWTAISLDDVSAAARGQHRLPEKAILLTFDDGYKSFYTRVYPLLKAYHYPAVSSLVGSWMEETTDGTVLYGDKKVPRTTFISWDEAREIEASGLVEFASHSYDLHHGVQANPQGNIVAAAITWRYDPQSRTYEDDAQYEARIRADLTRARAMMESNLGHPPRTMTWPYGRYTGPALDVAKELGFSFALTLEPEPAYTSDLHAIQRYFPSDNPKLGDVVRNLRFEPERPRTLRIACLSLDALAAAGGGRAQDRKLGQIIEGLRALGTNTVVIDANAALPSATAPLGALYFPTTIRPLRMRMDLLGRATWQIRTRGGSDVFVRLPLAAAAAAVGKSNVPRLVGEMLRHVRPDGIVIDTPLAASDGAIVADRPEIIRARRAALDPKRLNNSARLGLEAYRAAAAIDPRLRLMLMMQQPGGPPGWADIGLLPPAEDASEIAEVAGYLRAEGWLRPEMSARVAFALPVVPDRQVEALRQAQRLGASAFAVCPGTPALPPSAELSAAFSAASYPYRP
ncbi:poly-beta-1,6-N-acetyl-D-glucosamine N-deacetylase PgaB [Bradyrhizobium diazoefficiens]|nr:poly-beta-1,6-N-acetyl-D-glucosamine N-deacetylase PgaB [Bradyrhizobium diazoefficiens]MBR0778151.1 poly-beta-1,6-N-acetyl-D-glucosamine N-deacetylase PgaB [Bradyrhizobium diazoefficiens]